jgi:hypothetical protein
MGFKPDSSTNNKLKIWQRRVNSVLGFVTKMTAILGRLSNIITRQGS